MQWVSDTERKLGLSIDAGVFVKINVCNEDISEGIRPNSEFPIDRYSNSVFQAFLNELLNIGIE